MPDSFYSRLSPVISFVDWGPEDDKSQSRSYSKDKSSGVRGAQTSGHASKSATSRSRARARAQFIQKEGYTLLCFLDEGDRQSSAVAKAQTKGGHVVAIKFLQDDELDIILELQKHDSPQNHTIKVLHAYRSDHSDISDNTVIMPWHSQLDAFLGESPTTATSLWYQFLEGVRFLHEHGIAHLDLKPGNILVEHTTESSPRLSIIDFGISVRAKNEATKVEGYRGTLHWSAPEVGDANGPTMRYSPILADRWSCGRVLQHIGGFHRNDDASVFLAVQNQLLRSDPSTRPPLDQVFRSLRSTSPPKRGGDSDRDFALQKRLKSSFWYECFFYHVLSLKFIYM